jgi:hypothetical protein
MKLLTSASLAAILAAGSTLAQIEVPGDYATLQAAITAAAPGSTIVVTTPVLQGPIVIDKPLTIIGDPVANLGTDGLCHTPIPIPVELAGPGYGTVVLAQVNLQQCIDGGYMTEVLGGGGFSELHIYDSTVFTSPTGLTGSGAGDAAVKVSVPFVLVSGSTVIGGADAIDICTFGGFGGIQIPYLAYPAIDAPGSLVTLLDSFVQGGSHLTFCCEYCACPADLSTIVSPGGPGVVASEVLVAGGTVAGGAGARILADMVFCGTSPDGPAFVASTVDALPGVLSSSGPLALGTSWTLSYVTPGPLGALFFGLGANVPAYLPGQGWYFLGPDLLLLGPVPVGVPGTFTAPIPADPILSGFEVTFQLFDTSTGLSRPEIGVLVP